MPPGDLDTLFDDKAEHSRIEAEATFGLHEVSLEIDALPSGARVLEIGCGTGYLLAQLSLRRMDAYFDGLEPIGQGFAKFEETLSRIEARFENLDIHRTPIEDFTLPQGASGFDLIFSINVFEHLNDWRVAVDRAVALLNEGGRMIILCPNYSVPYEPHFAIPIIGGPQLTRRLFDKRIARIEAQTDSAGLWKSINFISVPALKSHCGLRGIDVSFDRGVMARMLDRLDMDPEFAKRQSAVAGIARVLRRLGAGWLLKRLPARFSPYMKAEVRVG
jgi:SAM-dependent methyltransferase